LPTKTLIMTSVEELRRALEDSVEDYLAFRAERGEEPEPIAKQFEQWHGRASKGGR
jgi:predicted HicB family RNase H-like nuclease